MTFASDVLKLLRLDSSEDKQHLVIRSAGGRGKAAEYSFGIEEEYFLADRQTFKIAIETPNALFESANWSTGGQAMRRCCSPSSRSPLTFTSTSTTRAKSFASCAAKSRMSRHNTASSSWRAARIRPRSGACRSRVQATLRGDDRGSAQHRPPQPDVRHACTRPAARSRKAHGGDASDAAALPLFIALSASSPFWNPHKTGLKGYRLAAYSELPRTGLPELFESTRNYDDYAARCSARASSPMKATSGGPCAPR